MGMGAGPQAHQPCPALTSQPVPQGTLFHQVQRLMELEGQLPSPSLPVVVVVGGRGEGVLFPRASHRACAFRICDLLWGLCRLLTSRLKVHPSLAGFGAHLPNTRCVVL